MTERTLKAPMPPQGRRLPPPRNRHTAPGNTRRQSQRVSKDGSTFRSTKRPLTRQNTWSGASSTTADRRAELYAGFCAPGPRGRRGDGHPSRAGVAAGLVRSTRGLGRAALEHPRRAVLRRPLLTLLQVGFTEPPESPQALVVSYTTVSPLPRAEAPGGLLSVALSRGSPRVGVTHHPALWSPDVPRGGPKTPTRPPARLVCRVDHATWRGGGGGPARPRRNSAPPADIA